MSLDFFHDTTAATADPFARTGARKVAFLDPDDVKTVPFARRIAECRVCGEVRESHGECSHCGDEARQ